MNMKERDNIIKKQGCLRVIIIVICLLSLLFAGFYIIIWRVSDNSVEIARIKTRIENRIDAAASIPVDQNGWFLFEKASSRVTTRIQRKDAHSSRDIDKILDDGVKQEDYDFIDEMIRINKTSLEEVDQAFEKKFFYMPVNYRQGVSAPVPNFLRLREMGKFLTLIGNYERSQGNYKKALYRYIQCFHFGKNIGKNGSLTQGMVGIAIMNICSSRLKDMLRKVELEADLYKYLIDELNALDRDFLTFREILDGEFIMIEYTFDLIRSGKLRNPQGLGVPPYLFWLMPLGAIIEREQKVYQNWYLDSIKILSNKYDVAISKLRNYKFPPLSIAAQLLIPNVIRAYGHFLRTSLELGGIRTMVALELFKIDKRSYPDNLLQLVPNYMSSLVRDPFTPGGQLIYKKTKDNLLLYSVGDDLKDDGAQIESKWLTNPGDIIFLKKNLM